MRAAVLIVFALGLAAARPLPAEGESQVNYSGARSSGRLDVGGVAAREQAMGRAATAAGRGPGAFLANPALVAGQGRAYGLDQNVGLFQSRSLLTASHGWGSISGALGIGYADLGAVRGTRTDGTTFNERPYQVSLDLGAGKPLSLGLSAGLAVHGLIQSFGSFGSKSAFGVTGGVGFVSGGWSLGFAPSLESDLDLSANTLLTSMSLGLAWSGNWVKTQKVTLAGQVDDDEGLSRRAGIGIENWSFGILALRGGYEVPLGQDLDYPTWTAGLGVAYDAWLIDFSYSGRDVLGSTQRVTLTWAPQPIPSRPAAAIATPRAGLPGAHKSASKKP